MSALTEDVDWTPVTDYEDVGYTEDEAYAILSGNPILTAATVPHTGAMIALVPSDTDLGRLALDGGEDAEELHLTLAYLGEATDIPAEMRARIMSATTDYFNSVIATEAFSVNVFNPRTEAYDTALVLGIRGEDLIAPRNNVVSAVRGIYDMPQNHEPWLPHVTLAYTDDMSRLADCMERLGALTFDKLRFAFGDEVTDIYLGQQQEEVMTASIVLGIDWETFDVSRLPPHLKKYWLGPKGSARVGGWGNEGSFRACQVEMRKEGVPKRMIDGLCANLYHAATGHTPNQKKLSVLTADGYAPEVLELDSDEMVATPEIPSCAAWEGVLTVEGVESGDGRLFALGSLDWAELPLPLMYQPANTGGHSGSVLVGQITHVARKNNQLYGWGMIDLKARIGDAEVGHEVYRLMSEEFLNGVSVDVDKVKDADVQLVYDTIPGPKPRMTIFHRGRVRGATLVAFPAFVEAQIYLTGDMVTSEEIMLAAARSGGWSSMPIADEGHTWDKGAAIKRLISWAGDDIAGKYSKAFLWKDSSGDPDLQGSYKFPIADVVDGHLTIIPNAVRNASARLEDSDIPASDKSSIHTTIESILNRIHGDVTTASAHTITIPDLPPAAWFNEPTDVALHGALTVTDAGRVYGLLAPGGTNYRGAAKAKAPVKNVDYSRFMGRETIVEGGGRVVTGVITMDCGHAPATNYGTLQNRIDHYDNSCSVVADVRIGETADGAVWIAGALKHYVTPEQVSAMMSCTLSGDWQPHSDRPGVREFVAALLVPVPGFAMTRTEASVRYEDGALTASAVPVEFAEIDENSLLLASFLMRKEFLGAQMTKFVQSRKLELAARLGK